MKTGAAMVIMLLEVWRPLPLITSQVRGDYTR